MNQNGIQRLYETMLWTMLWTHMLTAERV